MKKKKNKLHQVGKRPVHWKLQNIAKIKKNMNEWKDITEWKGDSHKWRKYLQIRSDKRLIYKEYRKNSYNSTKTTNQI